MRDCNDVDTQPPHPEPDPRSCTPHPCKQPPLNPPHPPLTPTKTDNPESKATKLLPNVTSTPPHVITDTSPRGRVW
eukprot:1006331-Rhodomonas_salina.1